MKNTIYFFSDVLCWLFYEIVIFKLLVLFSDIKNIYLKEIRNSPGFCFLCHDILWRYDVAMYIFQYIND